MKIINMNHFLQEMRTVIVHRIYVGPIDSGPHFPKPYASIWVMY